MKITFKNVAGYESQKESLKNLCMMINNYDTYEEMGIKLPKGLLIYGKPGVGKTLFAKAIAEELNRPIVVVDHLSVQERNSQKLLIERFEEAYQKRPAVLLIEDYQGLIPKGARRDQFSAAKALEMENLLLSLIENYSSIKELLVIINSERLNDLSPILTKSGPIDYQLKLDLPDENSRIELLKFYLNKLKLKNEVKLEKLAVITKGLTPAKIATIVNDASFRAIQEGYQLITDETMINQIRMLESNSIETGEVVTEDERKILTYHRLGHFIVGYKLKGEVDDLSIVHFDPTVGQRKFLMDNQLTSRKDIYEHVVILLGGRAAQKVFLNQLYTANYLDLKKAYQMIAMSVIQGDYGLEYYDGDDLYELSETIKTKIREVLLEAENKAIEIVKDNQDLIKNLFPVLLAEETLGQKEILKLLKKYDNN